MRLRVESLFVLVAFEQTALIVADGRKASKRVVLLVDGMAVGIGLGRHADAGQVGVGRHAGILRIDAHFVYVCVLFAYAHPGPGFAYGIHFRPRSAFIPADPITQYE